MLMERDKQELVILGADIAGRRMVKNDVLRRWKKKQNWEWREPQMTQPCVLAAASSAILEDFAPLNRPLQA